MATATWKVKSWLIHGVLVVIILGTIILWIDQSTSRAFPGPVSHQFSSWYGFYKGAVFSGVIGLGFYSIMGSRVWCKFGCPMVAILEILQWYFSCSDSNKMEKIGPVFQSFCPFIPKSPVIAN